MTVEKKLLKKVQTLWKRDDFRTELALEYRKYAIRECEEEISRLQKLNTKLRESQVKSFEFKEGNTMKKLEKLNFDQITIENALSSYEKKGNSKKTLGHFLRFLKDVFVDS